MKPGVRPAKGKRGSSFGQTPRFVYRSIYTLTYRLIWPSVLHRRAFRSARWSTPCWNRKFESSNRSGKDRSRAGLQVFPGAGLGRGKGSTLPDCSTTTGCTMEPIQDPPSRLFLREGKLAAQSPDIRKPLPDSRRTNPLYRTATERSGAQISFSATCRSINVCNLTIIIFDALEKSLGLKLAQKKDPVEVLVVDHLDTTPTEN